MLPDISGTCPSPGPRIFIEEGDMSFPFSPLHLVDPEGVIIILTIPQAHFMKYKYTSTAFGVSSMGIRKTPDLCVHISVTGA